MERLQQEHAFQEDMLLEKFEKKGRNAQERRKRWNKSPDLAMFVHSF
jgi:hypothetical protein